MERGDGGLDAPPGRARAERSGKIPTCGLTGAVHPLHIRVELGAARRLLQGLCHRVYTRHDTFLSRLLELNCAIHPSEALSCRESRPDPTSPRTPSRNVCTTSGSRGMACDRARTVRRSTWFSREVGPKVVFVCSRPRWPCEDCARRSSSRAREVCLAQAAFVCSPATPVFLDPSTHLDQGGFLEVVDTNQPTRNFYTQPKKKKRLESDDEEERKNGATFKKSCRLFPGPKLLQWLGKIAPWAVGSGREIDQDGGRAVG